MKKQLLSAVVLCALGAVGCGDEVTPTPPTDTGPKYNSADKISTYLEGKTLVMEGDNIPSHPNGFSEDLDLGASSQCYTKSTISVAGGTYSVVSEQGTLRTSASSPTGKDCDRTTKSGQVSFQTRNPPLIENVKDDGSCFDVTFNYGAFQQSGRGQVSQDGKTVKLELFFEGQAIGHRCADGEVGAKTVTLNKAPFTGNAVQTYSVQ